MTILGSRYSGGLARELLYNPLIWICACYADHPLLGTLIMIFFFVLIVMYLLVLFFAFIFDVCCNIYDKIKSRRQNPMNGVQQQDQNYNDGFQGWSNKSVDPSAPPYEGYSTEFVQPSAPPCEGSCYQSTTGTDMHGGADVTNWPVMHIDESENPSSNVDSIAIYPGIHVRGNVQICNKNLHLDPPPPYHEVVCNGYYV
ncbi:hypothetical protein EDL79_04125 [Ehrlichia ruminantium]|uniref:Uncharacterized protein n=1 Tax=Ehrlichia ruminantium TaxID=779 RepID=A0AAE6QAI5_EHRRU|nr:hypothetical protein [Ehrlichia ruminantium]QGR02800.1 hypothetical protein EDL81_04105 [Ehrlichia ruminantium]QGR03724.1 hypothetical protein EDL80_04115 [Ehrlichia ruminantium]QGR04651.1 hypothetical protein EDL79_04125 [Ehrlichia ruminantium]